LARAIVVQFQLIQNKMVLGINYNSADVILFQSRNEWILCLFM